MLIPSKPLPTFGSSLIYITQFVVLSHQVAGGLHFISVETFYNTIILILILVINAWDYQIYNSSSKSFIISGIKYLLQILN